MFAFTLVNLDYVTEFHLVFKVYENRRKKSHEDKGR